MDKVKELCLAISIVGIIVAILFVLIGAIAFVVNCVSDGTVNMIQTFSFLFLVVVGIALTWFVVSRD